MNQDSPFETWRLANLKQVAVSPEILKLLALAFEGGRLSKREWLGLTDEEIHDAFQNSSRRSIYRVIEAKLKEKNA